MEFILGSTFSSFLFVVSNSKYMLDSGYRLAISITDCSHVILGKNNLILENIINADGDLVFITFNENFKILAERITYIRDSLYSTGKCLIFGFLSYQLLYLQQNYPDFTSYSMIILNYSVNYEKPFSLLLSSEIVYTNSKNYYAMNARSMKNVEFLGGSDLDYIEYKVKKFKYVCFNDIVLRKLHKEILNYLNQLVADFAIFNSNINCLENHLLCLYRLINLVLDYLDILRFRNKKMFIESVIIPLFSVITLACIDNSFDIEIKDIDFILPIIRKMLNFNVKNRKNLLSG